MNTQLDTSKFSSAALRKIGLLPDNRPSQVALATVLWCKVDHDQPLIVEGENGVIFRCGGLTERQLAQLPSLMPELPGCRLVLTYRDLDVNGAPIDAKFKTLLLASDTRPKALRLLSKLDAIEGAVQ